jgi:hypothetical protein
MRPPRERSCTGKARYSNRWRAFLAAWRRSQASGETIEPYHCSYCHKWHIGHPIRRNYGKPNP